MIKLYKMDKQIVIMISDKTIKNVIVKTVTGAIIYFAVIAALLFVYGNFSKASDFIIIPITALFNLNQVALLIFLFSELVGWALFETK